MSSVMRKPTFCRCENKDADQLRSDRESDQRLCFRYKDSTIPLLSKSEISSHLAILAIFWDCIAWFVSDQVGNQNVGFLTTRLITISTSYTEPHTETSMQRYLIWQITKTRVGPMVLLTLTWLLPRLCPGITTTMKNKKHCCKSFVKISAVAQQ